MAINISMAGTPKANGKHVSLPRQWTFCLNSGIKNDEINEPKSMAIENLAA